ncbi:hypothetical protein H0E87_008493 [Populus deltoides]|uniref:Uncharacterized protein n=1 Tax=Populus deltoides TaxID=3696 RepID=A0A8T2Z0T4_POPDE|nr:hypothetical protein H0E87_008493 [Populus deltoides]
MKAKTERDDELVRLVVLLRLLFLLSGVAALPFLLVCAVAGAVGGVAIFVYWLLVSSSFYLPSGSSGGRIRLLCCSCLLLLKVAEELQLVMTAPLLVHAPSAEQNTATAGDGEKI